MESDVCIQASVFFRHCLKKKKIPKTMVAQLPIKYKQEKKIMAKEHQELY